MKNILFRDDQSLLGSNWYVLSKKLFIIPFILSFIGILAIYSLIGTEYSILLIFKPADSRLRAVRSHQHALIMLLLEHMAWEEPGDGAAVKEWLVEAIPASLAAATAPCRFLLEGLWRRADDLADELAVLDPGTSAEDRNRNALRLADGHPLRSRRQHGLRRCDGEVDRDLAATFGSDLIEVGECTCQASVVVDGDFIADVVTAGVGVRQVVGRRWTSYQSSFQDIGIRLIVVEVLPAHA